MAASARPGCGNQTALALSLAQSLTLFGNQLLEVKLKGRTPAVFRCSKPTSQMEFLPFHTLNSHKNKLILKIKKKLLVLFSVI